MQFDEQCLRNYCKRTGKKTPRVDTAKKLADTLGCTVDDLLKDAKAV